MTFFAVMMMAASSSAPLNVDMNNVPIEYDIVRLENFRVPISDSVRAATWDELAYKPAQPTSVRLACIVFAPGGAPGGCLPASLFATGQKTVDWANILENAGRSASPSEIDLVRTATQRIGAARLAPKFGSKSMFVVRFFEETVSPLDARPQFTPGETLNLNEVTLTKPLDATLLQVLYPVIAMRHSVNAKVIVTCRIEPDLKLLCRDPGMINYEPNIDIENLKESLRFATYQLASTMQVGPKGKDGRDITGNNLKITVIWQIP